MKQGQQGRVCGCSPSWNWPVHKSACRSRRQVQHRPLWQVMYEPSKAAEGREVLGRHRPPRLSVTDQVMTGHAVQP